jgi:predicted transcriptional regulator
MAEMNPGIRPVSLGGAEAERRRRLAWEAERIVEARAELDAGFFVDAAEVDAWIDSVGTEHELPPPPTRRC